MTLFAGRGPSLVDVRRGGIAAPTVHAVFCNKAEIIKELVSRLEAEADGEQWRARIGAERDPRRKLDLYAAWHRTLFSSGRDVLREEGDRSNQEWLGPVVDALVEAGLLAPRLTRQDAVDRMMLLSSVELYFRATAGRGWTDDQYQQWLTESLRQQLLAQPWATTPDRR